MLLPITPRLIGRRAFSAASLATGSLALLPVRSAGAQPAVAPRLSPTPRQTPGPFYPVDWSGDVDADLVRVAGAAAQAQGAVTHLRGRVLDADVVTVFGGPMVTPVSSLVLGTEVTLCAPPL